MSRVVDVNADPWSGNVTRTPRRHEVELMLPVEEQVGEIRRYTIVLPFLPPSKNVYDGWPGEWKTACKQKWVRHIREACEARAMPTRLPRIGLAAKLVFATNRRRDLQNYAQALWHFVPDALQGPPHHGYPLLLDDRDGAIDFGKNLGVTMMVDTHEDWPKKRRERTVLAITMQVS